MWNHPTWITSHIDDDDDDDDDASHDDDGNANDCHGNDDDDVDDAFNAGGGDGDARECLSQSQSQWLRSRFKRCDGGAPVVVVGPVRGTRDARCGRASSLVSPPPFERARRGVSRNQVREQVE